MHIDGHLPIETVSFQFLDVETSGLHPNRGARLTEIAVLDHRELAFHWTGAAGDDAALRAVLPRLQGTLSEAILVGHNIGFDLRFLAREAARLGGGPLQVRYVDTLALARRLAPSLGLDVPDFQLGTLLRTFQISADGPLHTAPVDAAATRALFWTLVRTAGLRTVQDVGLHRAAWHPA